MLILSSFYITLFFVKYLLYKNTFLIFVFRKSTNINKTLVVDRLNLNFSCVKRRKLV